MTIVLDVLCNINYFILIFRSSTRSFPREATGRHGPMATGWNRAAHGARVKEGVLDVTA